MNLLKTHHQTVFCDFFNQLFSPKIILRNHLSTDSTLKKYTRGITIQFSSRLVSVFCISLALSCLRSCAVAEGFSTPCGVYLHNLIISR